MSEKTYLQGAFILSLTNLVTGVIAFVYRVFLTKSIGAEGIGIYQLVLPLYFFFITLVSSGLITTISKLIAESRVNSNRTNTHQIIKVGLIASGIWSTLFALVICCNYDFLSNFVLKDDRTAYSILVFSPAIVFIALSAVIKGYFYGSEKVSVPAIIDIVEKLIRLVVLIFITNHLLNYGIEFVCAGAMLAMVFGEVLSLILLSFFYKIMKKKNPDNNKLKATIAIIKSILTPLMPLSISGAIESILDMVDAVLIPTQLKRAGLSKQSALSTFGELTGMVIPLLYFPLIIITSLSATLIPSIAYSCALKNHIALNKKCNDSLTIASIVGFAASILFISFPNELCKILYNSPKTGILLFWSALPCILEYWLFTIMAIMNGMGYQSKVMECSIVNILIVSCSIIFLMPIPKLNIYAYTIGFAASSSYVVLRGSFIIKKRQGVRLCIKRIFVKPLICAIIMYISIKSVNNHLVIYGNTHYNMIISYLSGLIVYFLMLFVSKTISIKQLYNVLSLNIKI